MICTHLTKEERYQIHSLKHQGISQSRIAAELGRSPSTRSRELARNANAQGYKPAQAQCKADRQLTVAPALYAFASPHKRFLAVIDGIAQNRFTRIVDETGL